MILSKPVSQLETSIETLEGYLVDSVTESQIEEYKSLYIKGVDEKLRHQLQYEYGTSLIRSRYLGDMHRGIILVEDLCVGLPNANPECFFYLSLGYARIKNFSLALKFQNIYIEAAPGYEPMYAWREFLEYKLKREARIGLARVAVSGLVVGGLVGSLVGIGVTLLKAR